MKSQKIVSLLPFVAAMFGGMFLLTGCEKDSLNGLPEGAMLITSEKSNGDGKTTVNGLSVNWQEGDLIKLNDAEYAIQLNDGTPYISGVDNTVEMYAGFPASAVTSAQGSTFTMSIPSSYTYTEAGGVQKLDMPMVAHTAADGTSMTFYHLCSTVNVRVINQVGAVFYIDTIIVTSASKPLCGDVTVQTTSPYVNARPAYSAETKSVKMSFTKNSVSVPVSSEKFIQIPVIFTTTGSDITVNVIGHVANINLDNGLVNAAASILYQNHANLVLNRATVYAAPCNMRTGIPAVSIIYPSFTMNGSGDKVNFSKGNLQYIASSNTWQFANAQTEIIGNANANISPSYDGPIDLFGWGTGTNPTQTSTTDGDYSTFNDWGNRTLYGSTSWRTLTFDEWHYLLGSRSGNRYVKAQINGREGVILFPDNYTPTISFTGINEKTTNYQTTNIISGSDWSTLEADGCIFLPTTGVRDGVSGSSWSTGCYWSSTENGASQAWCIKSGRTFYYYGNSNTQVAKHSGFAVRLVKDI